jgi:CRISPR-associated protein Cmr6
MDYPIPARAAQAFDVHRARPTQNAGLIFDRFAPDLSVQGLPRREQDALKKTGLKAVQQAAERADGTLLQSWNARWEAGVRAGHAEPFPLKTDWRLIAGLGRKGPLEVGFTFHRYGFPILPGSSVKGIARSYAWLIEERRDTDPNPDFIAIFGRAPKEGEDDSLAQTGAAIFFDAIPGRLPRLELDIMNPHYPKYYQGDGPPPTDGQNPIPVYFLTVASNTAFRFAVGWRGPLDETGRRQQALARDWLIGGLTRLGAGAKTSAGYGYFQEPVAVAVSQPSPPRVKMGPIPTPVAPLPVLPRQQGHGKLRNRDNKPSIIDDADPIRRLHVDWKALGMDALPDKTLVDYEYEALPNERFRVVKVVKAKK